MSEIVTRRRLRRSAGIAAAAIVLVGCSPEGSDDGVRPSAASSTTAPSASPTKSAIKTPESPMSVAASAASPTPERTLPAGTLRICDGIFSFVDLGDPTNAHDDRKRVVVRPASRNTSKGEQILDINDIGPAGVVLGPPMDKAGEADKVEWRSLVDGKVVTQDSISCTEQPIHTQNVTLPGKNEAWVAFTGEARQIAPKFLNLSGILEDKIVMHDYGWDNQTAADNMLDKYQNFAFYDEAGQPHPYWSGRQMPK